eukprot:Protomagalhaensia_wolfi_Nauph_80__2780@NODE_289_length_2904_cov_262_861431_g216_i0_p4_GENE_NODE_289_length_2904_cov_262_861431_g216_i0NODE_289_length_2904_cov_262_861431_g216_i0_p4_ORF_typecomplete_len107_score28_36RIB43A/PF05914_12/0_0072_NODE_289_length_2904_cov_262_861431_g216_i023802700
MTMQQKAKNLARQASDGAVKAKDMMVDGTMKVKDMAVDAYKGMTGNKKKDVTEHQPDSMMMKQGQMNDVPCVNDQCVDRQQCNSRQQCMMANGTMANNQCHDGACQ